MHLYRRIGIGFMHGKRLVTRGPYIYSKDSGVMPFAGLMDCFLCKLVANVYNGSRSKGLGRGKPTTGSTLAEAGKDLIKEDYYVL